MGPMLVTGGGDGLGRALALEAARRGLAVAVLDIRKSAAEQVAAECRALGVHAIGTAADVSVEADVVGAVGAAHAAVGPFGLVWANAGIGIRDGLIAARAADLAWLYDVNVRGILHTVRACHPLLAQDARIAITGSIAGLTDVAAGRPPAYAATKFAVTGIAEALRFELAPQGIGVTLICPGSIATAKGDPWRARPARFGGSVVPTEPSAPLVAQPGAIPLDATDVAAAALDAVESRQPLLILPESDARGRLVDRRAEQLRAAVRPRPSPAP